MNNDLRLELRCRNAALWHAIFDTHKNVAAFCRALYAPKILKGPGIQGIIGAWLNLTKSPYGRRGIDGGMLSSPLHLQAAKLGFSLLADLSTIGVDYQGAGVVTTRSFMREAPDTMRRYLRAYVEGLHRFKNDKAFAAKVIGKYSRMTEPDALEETYQHYAVKVMPRVPYPTIKGIQMVLDEIAARTPKATSLAPESFIDIGYLRELEQSGFVKKLYGE